MGNVACLHEGIDGQLGEIGVREALRLGFCDGRVPNEDDKHRFGSPYHAEDLYGMCGMTSRPWGSGKGMFDNFANLGCFRAILADLRAF